MTTEEEEMRRQQRMKVMKNMAKKIRSKGRMDAENRWWVAELLAAGCEKACGSIQKKKICNFFTFGWRR